MSCVLIIPSYKPSEELSRIVQELKRLSADLKIVVINDGSPYQYNDIFISVEKYVEVVIPLSKNYGKGFAIRNGLEFAIKKFPHVTHYAFCDDDGQHLPLDVTNVIRHAENHNFDFVIGARSFDSKTPWKSRIGNKCISLILRTKFGIKITDSQSGLRCFSASVAKKILAIPGERFGYELQTLIELFRENISPINLSISTLYFGNNRKTRFNPILDSARIIWVALKA